MTSELVEETIRKEIPSDVNKDIRHVDKKLSPRPNLVIMYVHTSRIDILQYLEQTKYQVPI